MRRRILMAVVTAALGLAGAQVATAAGGVVVPIDVHAERHGKTIRVTWRTAKPASDTSFEVAALPLGTNPRDYGHADGRGRRSFSVTLRPPHPRRVRQVSVYASNDRTMARTHVTVSVR